MTAEGLDPQDAKLVTLARSALARAGAASGAAVRDETGRSYVAVPVRAGPLDISAVALAVAMALASGATGLEAAALVGAEPVAEDLAVLRAVTGGVRLHVAGRDGTLRETIPA